MKKSVHRQGKIGRRRVFRRRLSSKGRRRPAAMAHFFCNTRSHRQRLPQLWEDGWAAGRREVAHCTPSTPVGCADSQVAGSRISGLMSSDRHPGASFLSLLSSYLSPGCSSCRFGRWNDGRSIFVYPSLSSFAFSSLVDSCFHSASIIHMCDRCCCSLMPTRHSFVFLFLCMFVCFPCTALCLSCLLEFVSALSNPSSVLSPPFARVL